MYSSFNPIIIQCVIGNEAFSSKSSSKLFSITLNPKKPIINPRNKARYIFILFVTCLLIKIYPKAAIKRMTTTIRTFNPIKKVMPDKIPKIILFLVLVSFIHLIIK